MKECSKSIQRRMRDPSFMKDYFCGNGIDIGGKPDPLVLYKELFPLMKNVQTWDIEQGNAEFLNDIEDDTYDFVHSSHCLEHLNDPSEGLKNWIRVLKKGGYLIVTVPDEDLYEQGVFPSDFNHDHKWTFTIYKEKTWSKKSINLLEFLKVFSPLIEIKSISQLTASYRYSLPRYDQTLTPIGECGIEFILRKRLDEEIELGGYFNKHNEQPDKNIRIHLNQYRNDLNFLKKNNKKEPPYSDDNLL